MTHKQFLKKQIIYRSTHRGSKEMDILLGQFVKKYINDLNNLELESLNEMLSLEDEILHNFYFKKEKNLSISNIKISNLLKNFKL